MSMGSSHSFLILWKSIGSKGNNQEIFGDRQGRKPHLGAAERTSLNQKIVQVSRAQPEAWQTFNHYIFETVTSASGKETAAPHWAAWAYSEVWTSWAPPQSTETIYAACKQDSHTSEKAPRKGFSFPCIWKKRVKSQNKQKASVPSSEWVDYKRNHNLKKFCKAKSFKYPGPGVLGEDTLTFKGVSVRWNNREIKTRLQCDDALESHAKATNSDLK